MSRHSFSFGAIAVLLASKSAGAAEFYVDPASGSTGGDGSLQRPWQTLEGVVGAGHFGVAIKAGDTVWLRSGYHGAFAISGGNYATPIKVAAEAGASPRLSRASFNNSHGWLLSGLSISPSHAPLTRREISSRSTARARTSSSKTAAIFSIEDASGWTAAQWVNDASSGVEVGGDDA